MLQRNQAELLVILDNLVDAKHPYRSLEGLFDFKQLCRPLKQIYSHKGRKDLGIERAFRACRTIMKFCRIFSKCIKV